mmetsp:Transcript_16532/g.56992  ORF Transcript_16532/g.56992 Transcript_16532/m.56992 type:complete len:163 (+) Transcript_16532:263-751(+)
MDAEQAQRIWAQLRLAVSEIYNKNASVLSFEELYRNAYNLVLHKHGDLLYDGVQETVEMRLRSVAEAVASSPDEQLLSQICEQWKEHQVTMVMVRDILMYMDRTRGAPGSSHAPPSFLGQALGMSHRIKRWPSTMSACGHSVKRLHAMTMCATDCGVCCSRT